MERLSDWALKNTGKLSLKVSRYSWVKEWMPGFYDHSVEISIGDKKFRGRGIDQDEEVSFEKAVAEAIERCSVTLSDLSNLWATAAYPTLEGAQERAYYELLGIDRVLCHHFCKIKMENIPEEAISGFDWARLKKLYVTKGLSIDLYGLRPAQDAVSVCAISTGGRVPGFVAGFGTSKTIASAALTAVFECVRTAAVCFFSDYQPKEPISELKRRGEPMWHFWMAQEKESLDYLRKNLIPKPGDKGSIVPENISKHDAEFRELNNVGALFPGVPLKVVKAVSDKLLEPQFGVVSATEAVLGRLEVFSGHKVDILSSVPHFYG